MQRCPTCGKEDHGPPRIEAPGQVPAISWSHGSGVVAAAHGPVGIGVDVEPRGSLLPDVDARRAVLTAAELRRLDVLADPRAAFFALWTAKEALVKVGSIAMDDFDRVDLGALLEAPRTRWHGWHLTSWSTSGAIGATASVAAMGGVVELSA
ncbi:MAG: 4'-phosphopantetheinyl transferase family protein [Marmoricola sp.]